MLIVVEIVVVVRGHELLAYSALVCDKVLEFA